MRFPLRLLASLPLCLVASGCSLLDSVKGPTTTSTLNVGDAAKQMSATIDGTFWFANFVAIGEENGSAKFTGVLNPGQPSERTIILQFKRVSGKQTFSETDGVYAMVVVGNSTLQSWQTRPAGPTGTIDLDIVAGNHYKGTFSFDAAANFSDLTPTVRKITNGTFDITW